MDSCHCAIVLTISPSAIPSPIMCMAYIPVTLLPLPPSSTLVPLPGPWRALSVLNAYPIHHQHHLSGRGLPPTGKLGQVLLCPFCRVEPVPQEVRDPSPQVCMAMGHFSRTSPGLQPSSPRLPLQCQRQRSRKKRGGGTHAPKTLRRCSE